MLHHTNPRHCGLICPEVVLGARRLLTVWNAFRMLSGGGAGSQEGSGGGGQNVASTVKRETALTLSDLVDAFHRRRLGRDRGRVHRRRRTCNDATETLQWRPHRRLVPTLNTRHGRRHTNSAQVMGRMARTFVTVQVYMLPTPNYAKWAQHTSLPPPPPPKKNTCTRGEKLLRPT